MKHRTELQWAVWRRRYCRELKHALAIAPEIRDHTLEQTDEALADFLAAHPEADYAALLREFGSPAQAAQTALNELDSCQLLRTFQYYRWQKILLATAAGVLLTMILVYVGISAFSFFHLLL